MEREEDVIDSLLSMNGEDLVQLLRHYLRDFLDPTCTTIKRDMLPPNYTEKMEEVFRRGKRRPAVLAAYLLTCLSEENEKLRTMSYRVLDLDPERVEGHQLEHWHLFLRFCSAKRIDYLMQDSSDTTSVSNHVQFVKVCQRAWTHIRRTGELPPTE